MTTNIKRRVFLKGSLAAGTVGVAVGAGLLTPQAVLAAWPKPAFEAKSVDDALSAAMGSASNSASDSIKIKAPDIAENGAVVPVSVATDMSGVESIALLADGNNTPLVATFNLGAGAVPDVATRIKMGKTGDVIAVVKAGGKLMSARKSVKVTIGGCGG
ncbi:thiosulfate oxidation carrier protein SoxY [Thiosocius teredinicola]|uniref:thiosulfate oxidation carrier protein SoxY n=1 Tax=Thiosocius teredinicola TaxID=1973002 RepID=UPI00099121E1